MTSSRADAKALTTELSFCRGDGLFYKVTFRKRLVTMPRTVLLKMRRRTRGFAREERAPMEKALESSPFPPSSKTLQIMEFRYMKTFWIMMSMPGPFPFIKNSL